MFLLLHLLTLMLLWNYSASYQSSERSLSVVMATLPFPGHLTNYIVLADEMRSRGHNVTFMLPELSDYQKPKELCQKHGFQYKPVSVHNLTYQAMREKQQQSYSSTIRSLLVALKIFLQMTDQMEDVIKATDMSQFDIAIISEVVASDFVCAKDSDLRTLILTNTFLFDPSLRPPWPFPSPAGQSMTQNLTFLDRLKLKCVELVEVIFGIYYWHLITSRNPDCWRNQYNNMFPGGHSLPLFVPSVIGFEYPRASLPLIDYVGPLIPKTLEDLPPEIEAWLNSKARDSVIFISMGTVVLSPESLVKAIVDGVPENYSVLWILDKASRKLVQSTLKDLDSKRFLIQAWVPQVSVLAHRSIAMSIQHGGAGGVHQALYFGVPIIVIPFTAEQPANALKIEYWKVGIQLDYERVTANAINDSISTIASGSYREEARKMSLLFKQAGGVDKTVELVEFYATVGYDHLKPAYTKYKWSWIQYYNVDVYSVLISGAIASIYLVYRVIKCCCKCFCRRNNKKKQE